MPFTFAMALALQAPSVTASPCEQLLTDFAKNEDTYSFIQAANQKMLKADRAYADATGDMSSVLRTGRMITELDQQFLQNGDRIIPLLVGHGCPLPDHVTSTATFRADIQACTAAKGTAAETNACNYIARAVAVTMAKAKAAVPVRRSRR